MTIYLRMYHCTPLANRSSITEFGVDPRFHQCVKPVTWWCDYSWLSWALAHVSACHEIPVSRLIVAVADVNGDLLKRTRWQGIYNVNTPVYPYTFHTHGEVLDMVQALITDEIPF